MPQPVSDHMRLDRLLSQSTGLSRSRVKGLLRGDLVTVNAEPVRDASRLVSHTDDIVLDGESLEWPRFHYVMLYKPAGYVCSTEEGSHPLVHELVEAPWNRLLHSAGRLDKDTTGLALLTDDGQWSHRITRPGRDCVKQYRAVLKHPLAEDTAERFSRGLELRGESRPTLPARLDILGTHEARVYLSEGRYHQVRRMFAACGNRVEALHRESIGGLVLDPMLAPGEWRELSVAERQALA